MAFPHIPSLDKPTSANQGWDLDFGPNWRAGILEKQPPTAIGPYPALVPQVDVDGNDLGGVMLPEMTVPLATYTGWNLRAAAIGAPTERTAFLGSFVPLRRTAAEAAAARDPRKSVDDRYKSVTEYQAQFQMSLNDLVREKYLLAEDVGQLLDSSKSEWEWIHISSEK